MIKLSQNNKIIVSAISVFVISFVAMLFFLEEPSGNNQANVLHVGGSEEETLVEQENWQDEYQEYLSVDDGPIFVTGPEGNFKYVSEEFALMLGRDVENLEGDALYNYINSKDLPKLVGVHTNLFTDKKPVGGEGPYRMLSEDHEVMVMFSITPILNDEDMVVEIFFCTKNITNEVTELKRETDPSTLGANAVIDKNSNEVPENSDDMEWSELLYPNVKELRENSSKLVFASFN